MSSKRFWHSLSAGSVRVQRSLLLALASMLALGARGHTAESFDVASAGDRIVFASADYDLYLLDLTSLEVSQLTRTAGSEDCPAFSPDGTKVVYSYSLPGGRECIIRLLSLQDRTTTDLSSDENCTDASPDFSRDGDMITFSRAHRWRPYSMGGMVWDDWDACTMKIDGSELRRVTNKFYMGMSGPRFAADSMSVLFSADIATANGRSYSGLFLAKLEDGEGAAVTCLDSKQVGKCAAMASAPDVDHRNGRGVFISDRANAYEYEVYLTQPTAAEVTSRKLTSLQGYLRSPKIAAEANVVYFLRNVSGGFLGKDSVELWKVNADGTGQARVAGHDLFQKPLSWRGK